MINFKEKKKIILAVVAIVIVVAGFILWSKNQKPGELDDFAKCLKDKGAIFYGAFWCPHCQNQKKLFGSSAKYLPYVECSTVDGNNQLEVCKQADVQGYPTWEFQDKSRMEGELTLKELSEKSGCPLPQ